MDLLNGVDVVRFATSVHVRGARETMGSREDPDVTIVTDRDHWIVVGISCVFVEENGRPRNLPGFVIEVKDHMKQAAFALTREGTITVEVFYPVFEMGI